MRSITSIAKIFNQTFGEYRFKLVFLVMLGLLGGILEGIGIGAIVPLLSFLTSGTEGASNIITTTIANGFAFVGIAFKFRTIIGLVVVLFFLRSIVLAISIYVRASITSNFMKKEMSGLVLRTLRARWEFILRQKAGYVQTTIVRDVQKTVLLLEVLAQAIQSVTGFVMYLAVAVSISLNITLLTLLLGAGLLLFFRPFIRKIRNIAEETARLEKSVAHHITEHLFGLKTVKASGREYSVFGKIQENLTSLRGLFVKNAIIRSLGTIFIQPIGLLFILAIFASTYRTPRFSIAVFAAVAYLIQKIFVYIDSGQNALHSISELIPYASNVNEYKRRSEAETEYSPHAAMPFLFEKSIEFKNVFLSYEGRGEILSNIAATVKKGEMVGIMGPSGAGKTSFADLLLRLFRPTDGAILVDGKNLDSISLDDWRKHIGYVSQDLFLLNESVEENIRFYDRELTREQIEDAARKAHIYDVVQNLPQRFKTNIGDRGVMLSAGQRQRIVLARVLARQPDILILDEATSALDSESEAFIKQAVKELRGKVTVLIIAHRLTTVMDVDRLLVIDNGKIVEEGSPRKLLKDTTSYFHKLVHLGKQDLFPLQSS